MTCPHCGQLQDSSDAGTFCVACGKPLSGAGAKMSRAGSLPRVMVTPPPDPYIGKVLNDRFVVESRLGEGGFGAVYAGTQQGTGRKVALKLLHPELTKDDNLVARFRREGLLLCKLVDAHTITTYDFSQTPDGTLFIAMELLEGHSLHDVLRDQAPIRWQRMLQIVSQMCSSLAEAHALGIVHRDLKPENIYLEHRSGNPEFVKILDFGIAKVMQGETGSGAHRTQLTASGQTLGTLEYMSPEQLMGKDLDGRSDVYALGVLTYELITNRLPFPDAKGPAQLITAQLRQIPDPPSIAYPPGEIPPAVDQIVLCMLEKDKAKRFQSVNDLRQRCDDLLQAEKFASSAAIALPEHARAATPSPAGSHSALVVPQSISYPSITPPPMAAPPTAPGHRQGAHTPAPGAMPPQLTHNGPASMASSANASYPGGGFAHPGQTMLTHAPPSSNAWLWIGLLIIALGAGVGAVLALAM